MGRLQTGVRKTSRHWLLAVLGMAVLAACHASSLPTEPSSAAAESDGPFDLAIHSYNYTDRYIDSFSVDGAWGGNVSVSDATSGGGGGTCCVRWYADTPLPKKYRVRWSADVCTYPVEVGGGIFDNYKTLWKEQDVELTTAPPPNPDYFEVHFYKDGHIEVAITDDYSLPRLKLPVDDRGRRPGVPDWARCTPEQMRTYVD